MSWRRLIGLKCSKGISRHIRIRDAEKTRFSFSIHFLAGRQNVHGLSYAHQRLLWFFPAFFRGDVREKGISEKFYFPVWLRNFRSMKSPSVNNFIYVLPPFCGSAIESYF